MLFTQAFLVSIVALMIVPPRMKQKLTAHSISVLLPSDECVFELVLVFWMSFQVA